MVAVKPIGSWKSPVNAKLMDRSVRKEKERKGKDVEKLLNKTVSTWTGKPKFSVRVVDRGKDTIIEITISGTEIDIKKWGWLDQGTPSHPISGSPRLAFNNSDPAVGGRAYVPKTKPGSFISGRGEPAAGPLHFPEEVQHPGFPARNWTKMIREMMEKTFGKRIEVVIKEVVEKGNK